MSFCTRFAPSPTGYLHLGHAYSAMLAHDMARERGGRFLLRIEDTDTGRCKSEYEAAIYEDLAWLGLDWEMPVLHQSDQLATYDTALNRLIDQGFCYPCSCSRRDIREALSAPHNDPQQTPDGPLYPGTCRHRTMQDKAENDAIRLDMARALKLRPDVLGLEFSETGPLHTGQHSLTRANLLDKFGDIVLARRDIKTASYHLAVVVDDAAQGVSQIVRGDDLFYATFVHRLLQALLDLPAPTYHHHKLIRDNTGKRLAKRDDALAIRTLRDAGHEPADIRAMVRL